MVFKPTLAMRDADGRPLRPIIDRVRGSKLSKEVYAGGEAAATKIVDTRRRERETLVLDDDEVLELARWAVAIEQHYGCPMDIEWAKDGESGGRQRPGQGARQPRGR
jgi:pyruvate,water dikinase